MLNTEHMVIPDPYDDEILQMVEDLRSGSWDLPQSNEVEMEVPTSDTDSVVKEVTLVITELGDDHLFEGHLEYWPLGKVRVKAFLQDNEVYLSMV